MNMKVCPECGESVQIESLYCDTCGKLLGKPKRNIVTIISILIVAIIASCILAGSQMLYRSYISTTYQPATCQTLNEQVSTSSSDHSSYIDIDITYDLITASGKHVPGESHILISDFIQAENLQNYYQVGSTYGCWSSAISSTHTEILREDNLHFIPLLLIPLYAMLFFFVFAIPYLGIYKPSQLIKKGIQVQGIVMKRKRKTKSNTSIVVFQTATNPPITYGAVVPGRYTANMHVKIIYDPNRPQENIVVGDKKMSQKFIVIPIICEIFMVGLLAVFALMGFLL